MAVMVMTNQSISFGKMFPFILMLGVTMVAAPGVPAALLWRLWASCSPCWL